MIRMVPRCYSVQILEVCPVLWYLDEKWLIFAPSLSPCLSVVPPTSSENNDSGNPSQVHAAIHTTSQQAHKLFGFMKDGAGKLFRNIKDSSSTVIQQVTRWVWVIRQLSHIQPTRKWLILYDFVLQCHTRIEETTFRYCLHHIENIGWADCHAGVCMRVCSN